MAINKTTRKKWNLESGSDDEIRMMWDLKHMDELPHAEIAKKLNRKFGKNRTEVAVTACLRRINIGDYEVSFDINTNRPVYERPTLQRAESDEGGWSDELREFVRTKYESGIKGKRLIESLRDEFGVVKTSSQVGGLVYRMKSNGEIIEPGTFRGNSQNIRESGTSREVETRTMQGEMSMLANKLANYDSESLHPVLDERREFVYKFMTKQADTIRKYDAFSSYGGSGMDLKQLMKLPVGERRKLAALLEDEGNDLSVENIDLWAVPFYWESTPASSIVLPVYIEKDSSKMAKKNLGNILNGAFQGIAQSGSFNIIPSKERQFMDRFEDLIRYNVASKNGKEINYAPFAEALGKELRRKDLGNINVEVVEDKLFENYKLKED